MSRQINSEKVKSIIDVMPKYIEESREILNDIEALMNSVPVNELEESMVDMLLKYDLFDESVLCQQADQ